MVLLAPLAPAEQHEGGSAERENGGALVDGRVSDELFGAMSLVEPCWRSDSGKCPEFTVHRGVGIATAA
jgi:hypothetical protein